MRTIKYLYNAATMLLLAIILAVGTPAFYYLMKQQHSQAAENQQAKNERAEEREARAKLENSVNTIKAEFAEATAERAEETQRTIQALQNQLRTISSHTDELSRGVMDGQHVVETSKESVVQVIAPKSIGSGFVCQDNRICTAYHVVDGKVDFIAVKFPDGSASPALLYKYDEKNDTAVLDLVNPVQKKILPFAYTFQVGQPVLLIGNQAIRVLGSESAHTGTINAIRHEPWGRDFLKDGRDPRTVIQYDAVTHPGDSGAPLFNSQGEVVGMVSFQLLDYADINFAIAAPVLRDIAAIP